MRVGARRCEFGARIRRSEMVRERGDKKLYLQVGDTGAALFRGGQGVRRARWPPTQSGQIWAAHLGCPWAAQLTMEKSMFDRIRKVALTVLGSPGHPHIVDAIFGLGYPD